MSMRVAGEMGRGSSAVNAGAKWASWFKRMMHGFPFLGLRDTIAEPFLGWLLASFSGLGTGWRRWSTVGNPDGGT
jgi:hypothetical protein